MTERAPTECSQPSATTEHLAGKCLHLNAMTDHLHHNSSQLSDATESYDAGILPLSETIACDHAESLQLDPTIERLAGWYRQDNRYGWT